MPIWVTDDDTWWTAAEPHRTAGATKDQQKADVIEAEIAHWQRWRTKWTTKRH
jgi:hypothetical protein